MPDSKLRQELLQLSATIRSAPRISAELRPLIDTYIALFDRWYSEEGPASVRPDASALKREELEAVQRAHSTVLSVAGEMKANTSASLVGLHQKEKMMIAYIESLPKPSGAGKHRKG